MNANARNLVREAALTASTARLKAILREYKAEKPRVAPHHRRHNVETCNIIYAELLSRRIKA